MVLSVSCTCCALVKASAECCGYLCSVSCQYEAVTHMTEPCALIPDSVHMCCTLVPEMLCHLSCGTDCPMWEVLWLPLRSNHLYNWISQFQFDSCNRHVTSYLEDYVSYQRFVKPGNAEIANKQELPILGMGIVIFKHYCHYLYL